MPFNERNAAARGSSGGRRHSQAKRKALAALHASRRGVRVHHQAADLGAVLARLEARITPPEPGLRSVRVVAQFCGVSDRTVRRWLSGEDLPAPAALEQVRRWLADTERT